MPADKYPSIYSGQMEAIVFIILQICFAARAVLKIVVCDSDIPQFQLENTWSRNVFKPIARERKYLMDCNSDYT